MNEQQKALLVRAITLVVLWSVVIAIGLQLVMPVLGLGVSSFLLASSSDMDVGPSVSESTWWCNGQVKRVERVGSNSWAISLVDSSEIDSVSYPVATVVVAGQWDRFAQAKPGDLVLRCEKGNELILADSSGRTYTLVMTTALPGGRTPVSRF